MKSSLVCESYRICKSEIFAKANLGRAAETSFISANGNPEGIRHKKYMVP